LPTSSFYTFYVQGNLFAGVLVDFVYFFFLHFLCARQFIDTDVVSIISTYSFYSIAF